MIWLLDISLTLCLLHSTYLFCCLCTASLCSYNLPQTLLLKGPFPLSLSNALLLIIFKTLISFRPLFFIDSLEERSCLYSVYEIVPISLFSPSPFLSLCLSLSTLLCLHKTYQHQTSNVCIFNWIKYIARNLWKKSGIFISDNFIKRRKDSWILISLS